MPLREHKAALEQMYGRYNRRDFVHPDPLEFLYRYDDPADREVVALVAGCLAYGRVAQILKSVAAALDRLGPHPARAVVDASPSSLQKSFAGFKHRFSDGQQVAAMLSGAGTIIRRLGSLESALVAGVGKGDDTVAPALAAFVDQLTQAAGGPLNHLLPDPRLGSACKRLNLMLRWLVRRDAVDVGDWRRVRPAMLLVPLDTHMHRISQEMKATARRAADLRTAAQITEAFRRIQPDDPVKYDFALTRLGIHPGVRRGSGGSFLKSTDDQGKHAKNDPDSGE